MCGLVGVISKLRNGFCSANMEVFDMLLFLDQLRGQDSTGVFCVNNVGNVAIAKNIGDSTQFLRQPEYKTIRQDAIQNGWAMIGHNRKATRGTIKDENAHPFWVDEKLVLVHNGTTFGDHKVLKDVEVDSHAIAHTLATEENVELAMQKVNAAYALIWYDVQKKRMNFLRNIQRPLCWAETSDAWYFCSEADMLAYTLGRANITILEDGGPNYFPPLSHETWTLQEDKSTVLDTNLLDCNYKAPAAKPVQSAANFPGHRHPSQAYWPASDDIGLEDGIETLDPPELERLRRLGEEISANQQRQRAADEALESKEADEVDAQVEAMRHRNDADDVRAKLMARLQNKDKPIERSLVLVETKRPISHSHPPPSSWGVQHTYKEWTVAKVKYQKQRVKVVCTDYLKDEAGPNMVYMTGKTVDADGLYVIFPIHKVTFEAITSPSSNEALSGKAEFSVEVDVVGWKAIDKQQTADKFEDTLGVITLTGRDSKIYSNAGIVLQ